MNHISPDDYEKSRNRLSELLKKAFSLPGLLPESSRHMEVARRKLFENQFEITLVGEFQGGKSTTFNNICDGREISPRGMQGGGLKTSGCIIRAQNLADPDEVEHAIVRWRNPSELIKGFDEILTRAIPKLGNDFKLSDFDLNSDAGRKLISRAAQLEIEAHQSNPTLYDPEDIGLVELIRFALLTAHFFADPYIEGIRNKGDFLIEEIQQLVTFPVDWQVRWKDWNPKAFRAEEIIFAFVASVDCRLHSPNLSRLGCAITDCPGLFASNWDSQVATDALGQADAVLYLVRGDQSLGMSDLKAIRSLSLGKGMILVGANCRTQSWAQARRILEANGELLSKQGLGIEPGHIHLYHAALALYSTQLGRGVDALDPLTLSFLKLDFGLKEGEGPLVIQRHLMKMVRRFWENTDPEFDGSFQESMAPESYRASRMPNLLLEVEKFVLSKKAKTILLGNGARIMRALIETESSLKFTEDNAQKLFEVRQSEFKQAEDALQEFQDKAAPFITNFAEDAPELLANSFWSQLEDNQEKFITKLSAILAKEILKIQFKPKSSAAILKNLKRHAEMQLQSWIISESERWLADIKAGNNSTYNATISKPMKIIHTSLASEWERVSEKQIPALDGIMIPILNGMKVESAVTLPASFISGIANALSSLRNKQFYTGAVALLAVGLITLLLFGIVSAPVLAMLIPILAFLYPDTKDLLLSGGKDLLKKQFSEKFGELEPILKTQIKSAVTKFVEQLKHGLNDDVVAHPWKIYSQRKRDSEKQFQMAEADRIQVGKDARIAREEHVSPLRDECEKYLRDISELFPDAVT